MHVLIRYFFRGLVVVVPIAITIYVVYKSFTFVDQLIARFVDVRFPGAGFLLTIGGIVMVGALVSNFIGKKLFELAERLFVRAPFVKIVYSSVRDLIEAFVGDKRRFDQPVLVSLTADGALQSPGFVTREDLSAIGEVGRVAVYFPQSYNFAGNLIFVDRARVKRVNVESSQLMSFIVSGGVTGF